MNNEHYPWCHSYTGYIVERRFEQDRQFEFYKCDTCGSVLSGIEITPAYDAYRKEVQKELEDKAS